MAQVEWNLWRCGPSKRHKFMFTVSCELRGLGCEMRRVQNQLFEFCWVKGVDSTHIAIQAYSSIDIPFCLLFTVHSFPNVKLFQDKYCLQTSKGIVSGPRLPISLDLGERLDVGVIIYPLKISRDIVPYLGNWFP
jgi:hypothetical protein